MAGIMIGKKSHINYIGDWQFGDTVRQELAGGMCCGSGFHFREL